MAATIPTPGELLRRLGVDPAGAVAEELPHNRWLSPGVWQVRTGNGQRAVLKREGVNLVHANRERLYQISESLPRTLCHLDFWPKNLFRRPDGQIVLIDWAFTGIGAVGEDAGNVVPDSVFDHFVPAAEMPGLEQAVYEGYLAGLRAGGWDDDPRLVRLGMWSSAVKYDWLAAFTLTGVAQDRQYRYGGGGEIDAAFKFRERSRALLFNAGWARQALGLADELGL